ncbi:hypothetical protein D1B31_13605 [Neobacillus notoginsengisoli]|uniref:Uncharacterized protein n=1 Tax=Neobacillus notoginsengisoli TaxID=1578198 RepID=A0A417YSS5_9BACI|nr:hypothetical protein D1B31_13605 [Neobacillus notoginsengisoli]
MTPFELFRLPNEALEPSRCLFRLPNEAVEPSPASLLGKKLKKQKPKTKNQNSKKAKKSGPCVAGAHIIKGRLIKGKARLFKHVKLGETFAI